MKRSLYLGIVILLAVFLFSCDDAEDAVTNVIEGSVNASNYYPGDVGTTFTYEGEVETDSTNVKSERESTLGTGKTISGVVYLKQTNKRSVSGVETSTETLFFRKDSKGVYFYIDSDELIELLDSLGVAESDVKLSADTEIKLISYPFTGNWTAFSVAIASYKGIPLNVDVMALNASYEGEEDIVVKAAGETKTAKRIGYTFRIGLPDAYEKYLPDVPSIEVAATAWFVQDIGLVKTEGSSFITAFLSGGNIAVADSSFTMTENLVSYNIVSND